MFFNSSTVAGQWHDRAATLHHAVPIGTTGLAVCCIVSVHLPYIEQAMSQNIVTVSLTQQQDYRFLIEFGAPVPAVLGDEPTPLGTSSGPSPVQLLAAAVGNCLSDSLLFALRKFKQSPEPIRTQVQAEVGRNAEGRLRVQAIESELHLGVPAAGLEHLQRALDTFEQYCTVTQTIAAAVPVTLRVYDSTGQLLK